VAIITRYFSTTGAGAADGTTWADRAVLLSAGTWSSVITGFSFAGSDSLLCLVGPGTYTITAALVNALFANPPVVARPLIFQGCDSSGVQLVPELGWVSNEPDFDSSGFPVFSTTTNVATLSQAHTFARMIKFTASGRSAAILTTLLGIDWCVLEQTTANTAAGGISLTRRLTNSIIYMNSSAYSYGIQNSQFILDNVKLKGVTGSSGNRYGLSLTNSFGASNSIINRASVIGFGGTGVYQADCAVNDSFEMHNSMVLSSAGDGVRLSNTASQTTQQVINRCCVANNGAYGIVANASYPLLYNTRLRNNTSGDLSSLGNYPVNLDVYTTAASDSDEFVDSSGGDYRIKSTAAIWGKGYGAGDEPSSGGSALPLIGGGLVY